MTEVNQRIENIHMAIDAFRKEQEVIILRSVNDMRYKQDSKVKLTPQSSTVSETQMGGDQLISKILNVECILMPQPVSESSHQKLWPLALTSNRNKNVAEIGNIESQGSLWKLVQRKDSAAGYRVIFQTVCGGDSIQYLAKDMSIVVTKADAAVWNVQAVANTSTTLGYLSTVDPSDPMNTSNRAGVCVQFELVESGTGSVGEGHSSSLLVCSHNEGLNRSEAALVAFGRDGQTVIVDGDGHRISRCHLWEVMPDSWIDCELDFLDGYI